VEKPERKRPYGRRMLRWGTMLKWILGKQSWRASSGLIWLKIMTVGQVDVYSYKPGTNLRFHKAINGLFHVAYPVAPFHRLRLISSEFQPCWSVTNPAVRTNRSGLLSVQYITSLQGNFNEIPYDWSVLNINSSFWVFTSTDFTKSMLPENINEFLSAVREQFYGFVIWFFKYYNFNV